jgi:hypothetical protein
MFHNHFHRLIHDCQVLIVPSLDEARIYLDFDATMAGNSY